MFKKLFLLALSLSLTGGVFAADLTGTAPKNTYKNLLQAPTSNVGLSTGLVTVQDGAGNNTAIQLSTTLFNVSGTFQIGGVTVSLPISIGNGGTGAATAANAFNALSPLTTTGDILYGGTSGVGTRLGANSTSTKKYLQSVSSGNPSWQQVSTADLTGTLGTNNGGTGATTAGAAFDALSPLTTAGDILYGGTSGTGTRLGTNTTATKKYLQTVSSGNPAWIQVDVADTSGTLAINRGGTGTTTANNALNALLPDQTGNSGQVLKTDGTNTLWAAVSGASTTFNDSTFAIFNNSDNNKVIAFSAASITTGNTRTLTVPDANITLVGAANAATLTNKTISGASNTLTVRAASDITGQLPIANGGTAATTASGGFDALSPMTTLGDVIYGGTSGTNTRLAGNTTSTKKFLRQTGNGSVSAAPAWDTITSTDVGLSSVENTALSTWVGSANITTLGTISTGTWSATTMALNKGGTGQTTKAAAFDALQPMTTLGDIVYGGTSGTGTRLGGNTTTTLQILTSTGVSSAATAPVWTTPVLTHNTDFTKIASEGTLGTLTWGGTTAPSGTVQQVYKWTRIGPIVIFQWRIDASVAGASNTSLQFVLPSDCPAPVDPTGTDNNEFLTVGSGWSSSSHSTSPTNTQRTYLHKNSGSATGYYVQQDFSSTNVTNSEGTIIYPD